MTPEPLAPIVTFRGVSKVYGDGSGVVRALDDVSVDIQPGQFTAVMGPSGSGKSTFMNLAAGLDDPTSGEIWVAGRPLHALDDDARTVLRRTHVGFVFQAFNLVPTLSAIENVLLPFQLAGRGPDAEQRVWVDTLMRSLGLADRAAHRPGELSGGQQQRVAIARALASRPQIVVADEPTGNLDSRAGAEILGFMAAAVRDMGQTVVMVTHDPVAASYADAVIFLADGRVAGRLDDPTAQTVLDALKSIKG